MTDQQIQNAKPLTPGLESLLRSVDLNESHPLGSPDNSTASRQAAQDSNNWFTVAAWFAGQAASRRVPFLFLSPEDFGGNRSHGPASPWSLVEFRCLNSINDVWRGAAFMCRFANTEQRHPTGFLTNIQGLLRSLVVGWPQLKSINGELVYLGPLPRVCSCTVRHHESLGTSSGSFNSSTSLTMGYAFWHRIFSGFWSKDKFSLRDGRTAIHNEDVQTASLADAVGSWQPLYEHWKQGLLTRRLLSEYTGSQEVEHFLSTARAGSPAHSLRLLFMVFPRQLGFWRHFTKVC